MGGAIQQIGNAIDTTIKNPVAAIRGTLATGNPLGGVADANMSAPGEAPAAPAMNPELQRLHDQQQSQAKEFRSNLPSMKNQMSEDLKVQNNQAVNQANKQTQGANSARGLLYSGINQGQKLANRSQGQSRLAAATSEANTSLDNAANNMDSQAIQTGVGIQQNAQAIQNQIYSQAQARLAGQNAITGSAIGFGMLAGLTGVKGS